MWNFVGTYISDHAECDLRWWNGVGLVIKELL